MAWSCDVITEQEIEQEKYSVDVVFCECYLHADTNEFIERAQKNSYNENSDDQTNTTSSNW